jgi:hypothetical protein
MRSIIVSLIGSGTAYVAAYGVYPRLGNIATMFSQLLPWHRDPAILSFLVIVSALAVWNMMQKPCRADRIYRDFLVALRLVK